MREPTVQQLVDRLHMQPHPEGGFFVETYRAKKLIPHAALPDGFHGDRNSSTAIYYLLPSGAKSKLHRLATDEIFHFYLGDPMTVVQIAPNGRVTETVLGHDILGGQTLQHVIPQGDWFGGFCNPASRFSLVGCTVAPGFDFADFEMADREQMLREFPHAHAVIERLMA